MLALFSLSYYGTELIMFDRNGGVLVGHTRSHVGKVGALCEAPGLTAELAPMYIRFRCYSRNILPEISSETL